MTGANASSNGAGTTGNAADNGALAGAPGSGLALSLGALAAAAAFLL